LADAFHGTTVYLSSTPSSTRHDEMPAKSDVTDDGRATGNAAHDIPRYIAHVGAVSEIVVLPAAKLGGQHAEKDGCAFSEVLSAGAPLLVVPEPDRLHTGEVLWHARRSPASHRAHEKLP
jgi:hypothetical protein